MTLRFSLARIRDVVDISNREWPIRQHLALSPVGGRVALHTDLSGVHMPNALLHVGSIEIWSIDRRQSVKRDVNAIDSPLAWFPDGKRLAYVKLADPRAGAARQDDTFARKFRNWKKIPSVFVWDVDAGTETFLHVGSAARSFPRMADSFWSANTTVLGSTWSR